MSGVAVINHLLRNAGAITALVPAAKIKAGILPLGTAPPAISVTPVSSNPVNHLRITETNKMHVERVQVTVLHTAYPGLYAVMKILLAACPSQRGTVNTIVVDSIAPDTEGPYFYDPQTQIHAQSRDFIVRWTE